MIRVLLVDDEPIFLMVTKAFLEKNSDIQCDTCESAIQAIERSREIAFDAIVSDYEMSEMNGIEFLKKIREIKQQMPFIILTGRGREEVVIEALNNGANFYLQKGSDPSALYAELANAIKCTVERNRALEDLKYSEEINRLILDSVTENVVFQDPECRIVWANHAAVHSAGVSVQDLIGRYCHEIWHNRSKPCDNCPVLGAICSGEQQTALTCSPEGREWITRGSPIVGPDGAVIGGLKTGLEITALRAAESELIRSKERLDLALEGANLAVWDWYPADQKFLFDTRYADMLGYSPEELKLQNGTLAYLTHPEDLPATECAIHDHFAGKTPYAKVEFRMRCKDGTWKWIFACGKVVQRDNEGAPIRMVGVHQDISEQKTIESALRDSEQQLKLAIDGADIGIWDLDITTGRIVHNEHVCSMLGYAEGEMETDINRLWDLAHPDDLPAMREHLDKALTGALPYFELEYRLRCKDRSWKWIYGRGMIVERDRSGNPLRLAGIHLDISHTKHLQEGLRQAHNKLKLLSSITRHDITNQVTGIRSFLSRIEENVPHHPKLDRYLAIFNKAMQSIESQIVFWEDYQVLGEKDPQWQNVRQRIQRAAMDSDIKTLCIDDALDGVEVFADPMLGRVFYNILENAVRHGGDVTTIRAGFRENGGAAVLVIEDEGIGIPASMKERIFQQGVGKHTGRGLFLAKEILDITGITIRETGEEGNGARFEIAVPKGKWRSSAEGRVGDC